MNEIIDKLERTIGGVLLGKPRVIRLVLTGFFAQGHMLIEDPRVETISMRWGRDLPSRSSRQTTTWSPSLSLESNF